jgi:4-hydroxy-2-oxoheptanedioate aldolase
MLRENFLKEKLDSGRPVIGTVAVLPSTIAMDVIASSGLDFIMIDYEHGPIGFETAQDMAITCESRRVSPVVRVGGVICAEILRALDIGAHCVHIPNITNLNEIKEVIHFSKYPPLGNRGFSPFTRSGGYSHENTPAIMSQANDSTLLAIHIEGREAMANFDALLQVKQIDIIFIGIYDLSKSLGIPGQVDNPQLFESVKEITGKILRAGKYAGTFVTNRKQLEKFIAIGMKYILYSVDCEMLLRSYKEMQNSFEEIKGLYSNK